MSELVVLSGILGDKSRFRLLIEGDYGLREVTRLIELLRLLQTFITEDDGDAALSATEKGAGQ